MQGSVFIEQENKENKFSSDIKLFEHYDFDSHSKRSAYAFCKYAHGVQNQVRKFSGLPYHTHPEAVAKILESYGLNSDEIICAALCHDVIEDTYFIRKAIEERFGTRVADLVEQVSNVSKLSDGNRKTRKEIDRQHYAKADYDGKSIKLADLIHNSASMKDLKGFGYTWMKEMRDLLEVLKDGNSELWNKAKQINDNYFNREVIIND